MALVARLLDLKPLDDLGYFVKRSFMPYQEGELGPDLGKPFIALFGLVFAYCFILTGIIVAFYDLIKPPKAPNVWQRIKLFIENLVHTAKAGIFFCFLFIATPVFVVRPILRLFITVILGWGPSASDALVAAIKDNDVTAIRNFPRRSIFSDVSYFTQLISEEKICDSSYEASPFLFIQGYKHDDTRTARALAISLQRKLIYQALLENLGLASWHRFKLAFDWDYICQKDDTDFATVFLEITPEIFRGNNYQEWITDKFHQACVKGAVQIIGLFENHYAKILAAEKYKALVKACRAGSLSAVKQLIELGYVITDPTQQGEVLKAACSSGNLEMVTFLEEEKGYSVDDEEKSCD